MYGARPIGSFPYAAATPAGPAGPLASPPLEQWPARLPLPAVSGYTIEDDPSVSRTEFDVGAPRQRRRSTAPWSTVKATWYFTVEEYSWFEAWLRHRVGWSGWFQITLLMGLGLVSSTVRFNSGKAPASFRNGLWVEVQATLDVRERPMIDEPTLNILLFEDQAYLLSQIAAFNAAMAPSALWPHYTP
ncbi:MAG: hypothetical protein LCH95_24085 [Proteobacteria bacterium]|nr:hypothetical protein [Pseudomonadota bacterium]